MSEISLITVKMAYDLSYWNWNNSIGIFAALDLN